LPGKERIRPVRLLIESCKNTLHNLNPDAILKQKNEGNENVIEYDREQWDISMSNLDAALKSAVHQAGLITVYDADNVFNNSSATAQELYLDTYKNQSQKYNALLGNLISELKKADGIATDLLPKTERPPANQQ
jgi:hypothetical protein